MCVCVCVCVCKEKVVRAEKKGGRTDIRILLNGSLHLLVLKVIYELTKILFCGVIFCVKISSCLVTLVIHPLLFVELIFSFLQL